MSIAAAHYKKFVPEAIAGERVFTLEREGKRPVFPVDGHQSMPFWSTLSRAESARKRCAAIAGDSIVEMTLNRFLSNILPGMDELGIRVAANWIGVSLSGYDV